MNASNKRLVVIGGVAGGTSAASRARRTDPNMDIVIFEKGSFVSYGACDEPYYIAGEIPSWDNLLVRRPEEFESRQNIRIRLDHEVTSIDVDNRQVLGTDLATGKSFRALWDQLVIATGAFPRPLDVPGHDLPGVFQLKFIDQARRLKEFIDTEKPKKAIIVGAGYVALEMAEALRANNMEVTICHRSERPGVRLEPEISEIILDTLNQHGVRYLPSCEVKELKADNSRRLGSVRTNQGDLETQLVLTALGVKPAVNLAEKAGIRLGPTGAIAVDERQCTNIPGIYAAGDCCEVIHRLSRKAIYTPLGDIANKQGWTAGENAAGGNALFRGTISSTHFRCFDLEVGVTGLDMKQAAKTFDPVKRTITHRSRAHAQPKGVPITVTLIADRPTGRLIGAQIAGTEGAAHRINTLAVMVHNAMTISQMNELDFAYAPPFSPVIDPILTAARVLLKDLKRKT